MKRRILIGVLALSLVLVVPLGYAFWTTTKTGGESYIERVEYSLTYHYAFPPSGSPSSKTLSGLEIDGNFVCESFVTSGYRFDGWTVKNNSSQADFEPKSLITVRSVIETMAASNISPTETTNGRAKTIGLHLYDCWTEYSAPTGKTITVKNVSGQTLYTYDTGTRSLLPVFLLAELDNDAAHLDHYQLSVATIHYDAFGETKSSASIYLNDTLDLIKFSTSTIEMTAYYNS